MALRFRNLSGNPYAGLASTAESVYGRLGSTYLRQAEDERRRREREDAQYNQMLQSTVGLVAKGMEYDLQQDRIQYNKNLQKFKLEDSGLSAQLKSLKPQAMQKVLDARSKAINSLEKGEDFKLTEGGLFGVKLGSSDYRPTTNFKTQKDSLDVWDKLRKANDSSYSQAEKAWRKEFGVEFNEDFGGEKIPSMQELEVMRKNNTLPKGIRAFENEEGKFEFTTIPDKNEWIEQNYQGVTSRFPTYEEWIGGGGRFTGYSGGALTGGGNRREVVDEMMGQVDPKLLGKRGSKEEERSTVGGIESTLSQALEGKSGEERKNIFDRIVDYAIDSPAYKYLAEKFMGGDQEATASPTSPSIPQDTGMQNQKEVSEGLQTAGGFQAGQRSSQQEREEQESLNEYFGSVRRLESVDPNFSKNASGNKKGEAFAFTVAPDGRMDAVHRREAGKFIEDNYLSDYRKNTGNPDDADIDTADLIKAEDQFRSDAIQYHLKTAGTDVISNELMTEVKRKAEESTKQFMSLLSSAEGPDRFQGVVQRDTKIIDPNAPTIRKDSDLVAENIRKNLSTSSLTFVEPDLISQGETNVERPDDTEPLKISGPAKDVFLRVLGEREPRFRTRLYTERETGKEMIRITEEVTGESITEEYNSDSDDREGDRLKLQIKLGRLIFDKYKDNPLPTVTEGVAPDPKTKLERILPDNITTDSIAVTPERPSVSNEMASLESSLNTNIILPPTVDLNKSEQKSLLNQSGSKNTTAFAKEKKYDGQASANIITDDPVDIVNQQRLNYNPYEISQSPSTPKKSVAGSALNPKLESEEDIFVKAVQVATNLNEQQEVSYGGETYNVEIPPEALVLFVDMEAKRVVDDGKNKFHVNFQKMDGNTPSFGIGQMKEDTLKDINEARVLNGETPITPEDMKTDARSQLEATASYLKYIIYPECQNRMGDKWDKLSPSEKLELAYLRYNGGVTWKPESDDGWEPRSKQAEKNFERIKRLIDERNLRAELDAGFEGPSFLESALNFFSGGRGKVQAGETP